MTTLVTCGVLLAGILATAADHQKKGKKSNGAMTVSGCLQKGTEANTYMLTNVSSGGSYELIGAPASMNLAPHVGHRIEVTGTVAKASKAAKMEGAKGAEKKEEKGERHLQVRSFKMMSPTCP
ncbi:MAG: hypothetical protein DMF91_01550 [Acidobacteria bacterium]|nr:MAG: hypothetical protein DMF91_01550 [Acidobacteriota bacterium]